MKMNLTRQSVSMNEVLFEQTVEQPIDTDFTLPDYCPDIVRVLKCRVVPRITSKNISGDSLNIEGTVSATLIYSDENSKICSFEHEVDFQKILSIGESNDNSFVNIKISSDYMNCRAVTPRKMDIHGVLCVKVKMNGCKENDIITDIDCEGVQIKSGSCPATNPLGYAEKIVVIEEELELSRGNSSIRYVLRNDSRVIIDECKLIGNKAVVKGDIIINALYCTDDGNTEIYENRVPYNQILDIEVAGEDCKCDADIDIMSSMLKPRTNISGESKSFAFECKLCIVITASCENDIPVIYDAFCTKHDCELSSNQINFKKLDSTLSERYMCKKTLDFSENTFGSVIDMWCENKIGQVKIVDKQLMISGTTLICILLYDNDGSPQYFERSVDFDYSHNLESNCNNLVAEAQIETASTAYTVMGSDKLEARVELCISASIYSLKSEKVVTGINVNEEPSNKSKKAPIVIYYASAGEDVWEISKRYNACCNDILDVNNLNEDTLKSNTVLLIP